MASRYGTSRMLGCLPKFLLIRFFSVKEYAIGSPQNRIDVRGPSSRTNPVNKCAMRSQIYLTSTFAPASSSFFLKVSESALFTPSFTVEGTPSTRSFASFRPRPVISRITLITVTFLSAGYSFRRTVNSVFSSAGAAAAAPPRRGGDGDRGSGGNAELLLEVRDELYDLDEGQFGNCIEDFVFADSHVGSPNNKSRQVSYADAAEPPFWSR